MFCLEIFVRQGFANHLAHICAGQAASATASTSNPNTKSSAQPSSGTTDTSHAAEFLATRLASSSPSPSQPAPHLPAPLKKRQYRAEPAPSLPSNADAEMTDAEGVASVAGTAAHLGSAADKQVELLKLMMCGSTCDMMLIVSANTPAGAMMLAVCITCSRARQSNVAINKAQSTQM